MVVMGRQTPGRLVMYVWSMQNPGRLVMHDWSMQNPGRVVMYHFRSMHKHQANIPAKCNQTCQLITILEAFRVHSSYSRLHQQGGWLWVFVGG